MHVVFQHLRNTSNLGDRWCSPYDWFAWPNDFRVKDIREDGEKYDVSIIGGGKIFGGLNRFRGVQKSEGQKNVAWGVSTVQSFPISFKYFKARRACDLIGTRDWGDKRFIWAPCVSCMAPQFDIASPPKHKLVFYYHAGKTAAQGITIPKNIPSLSNNANSLEEALNFISSGEIVVSNSYHGVYWALLMGRKVLCIPFSNKFYHYRKHPGYSNAKDWLSEISKAKAQPDMLRLCRDATLKFHDNLSNFLQI